MADPSDLELIEKYWKLADECIDDALKIKFFDSYPEVFELGPKELEEARIAYSEALIEQVSKDGGDEDDCKDALEDFLDQLSSGDRKNLPDGYKLEAFDCVIELSPVFGHLRDK